MPSAKATLCLLLTACVLKENQVNHKLCIGLNFIKHILNDMSF